MKFTKKLFAAVIALCLMLCLSVTAFANDATGDAVAKPTTEATLVAINKKYKHTNEDTVWPKETFTLEKVGDDRVADGEAESVPPLGAITGVEFTDADSAAEVTKTITIQLPIYDTVGIYEYHLKETIPAEKTAGVDYHAEDILLRVTVTNNDADSSKLNVKAAVHTETGDNAIKSDTFVNTYSAGSLEVSKEVKGNLGDKDKKFKFKVDFTAPAGKTVRSDVVATIAGIKESDSALTWNENSSSYEFELADGETASFDNLPYGVSYTVTETDADADGYTITKTGDTGTINAATQTAAFTNTKEGKVDMGVTLDNLPYILVLAAVLGGAVVMFTRKRRFED